MMVLPPRSPGWRARLYSYLAEVADTPHAYGTHDCALFSAGAIRAMHGVDPAAAWRGRYSTWTGGLRVLRRAGYADHVAVLASLGQAVAPMMAQIGDFAVVDTHDHPAIGIVTGAQIQLLRPEGLAVLPLVQRSGSAVICSARAVWRT